MFSTECFHQNVNKMFKGMHPKLIFCCSQHWRWNRCTFENEANIVLLAFCNAMFDCFISSSKLQYNIWLFHYLTVTMALELCNALFGCFISSSILQCNILFQIFIFFSQEDLGKPNTVKTMSCEGVKIWICGWIIGDS